MITYNVREKSAKAEISLQACFDVNCLGTACRRNEISTRKAGTGQNRRIRVFKEKRELNKLDAATENRFQLFALFSKPDIFFPRGRE